MAEATAPRDLLRPHGDGELEIRLGGQGPEVLLLHGSHGWWGWEPVHELLAAEFSVIAPSHPGFGRSTRVPGVDTMDDLAYFYLDLMAEMRLTPARIVGFGLGGWLAAEIAVRTPDAVDRLVLVDSVGIKVSDRETLDVGDPFVLAADPHQAMLWHDPTAHQAPLPHPGMEPTMLEAMLRNHESAMYYGFKPYMHNPKLKQRLHRIKARTLVVWGADDRLVTPSYGEVFAASIPGAQFVSIPEAGHYPHRERPEAFVPLAIDFLRSTR
ncbi:MAG: hypothetical protein QOF51_691 [Chloroflexota bacterium]|nr:hypothetical protein [Chloroflexota bacterium]